MSRRSITLPPFAAACALLLLAGTSGVASAHDRGISYSTWNIDGRRAHVSVRLTALELSRLPASAAPPDERDREEGAYLTTHLQLFAGDAACPVSDGPRRLESGTGLVEFEWGVSCAPAGALRIHCDVLFAESAAHLHMARVSRDGGAAVERVLSDGERDWPLDRPAGSSGVTEGTSFLDYLELGIKHILTGYDHLAFLLALLLVETALFEVTKVVTGFTVAHSITLGLAVLGYVRPDSAPIEALIGLSIALVATENIWLVSGRGRAIPAAIAGSLALLAVGAIDGYGRVPALTLAGLALFSYCYFGLLGRVSRPVLARWAIAFIFGLIHGFGFAGVLAEAHLPPERLVHALFGFNLGVETGQLGVVLLIWPLLRLASHPSVPRLRLGIVEFGSATIAGLGLFWFVTRAYG